IGLPEIHRLTIAFHNDHVSKATATLTRHQPSPQTTVYSLSNGLRRGELGDGLGALGDGVLGELAGEDEAHGGLDLAGGDGGLLVVAGELGGLRGELLEDVVDEGVHDGHGLGRDADVRVHLLQHLEDVDLVRLHALLGLLLPLLLAALLAGGLARREPLLRLGLLPRGGLLRGLVLRGLLRRRLLLRLGRHRCPLGFLSATGKEGGFARFGL
ncbi:hypothetical protein BS78_04G249400, partial [Paspalum vaginatum]